MSGSLKRLRGVYRVREAVKRRLAALRRRKRHGERCLGAGVDASERNAICGPAGGVVGRWSDMVVLEYSVRMFLKLSAGTSRRIAALSAPEAEGFEAAMAVTTAALQCSEPTPEARSSWETR